VAIPLRGVSEIAVSGPVWGSKGHIRALGRVPALGTVSATRDLRPRRALKFARFSALKFCGLVWSKYMKHQKIKLDTILSATQGAAILGVSLTWLSRLVRDGYITPVSPRKFRLIDVVQGYIRFLSDERRRAAHSRPDAELKAAKAREIELRTANREAALIDVSDVDALAEFHTRVYRSELKSVSAVAAGDPALQRRIAEALNAAVERFEERYRDAREALRAGRDPLSA